MYVKKQFTRKISLKALDPEHFPTPGIASIKEKTVCAVAHLIGKGRKLNPGRGLLLKIKGYLEKRVGIAQVPARDCVPRFVVRHRFFFFRRQHPGFLFQAWRR